MEMMRVVVTPLLLAGLLIAEPGIARAEGKPQQHPTEFKCQILAEPERSTCERTRIAPPEPEPPAPARRTAVPQPIYPGGKLPPPALPAPRGGGS